MGMTSILSTLSIGLLGLGLLMGIPAIHASLLGGDNAPWLFAGFVTLAVGAGLFAATGTKRPPSDFRGGLLLVFLWWTIAPLFAALPLILNGASIGDGLFESISALTTTGAWLSIETLVGDPTGLLWRALLQWVGGLVSIAFAAAIIVRPAFYGLERLHVPFSRGDDDSYLRSFHNGLVFFAGVYLLMTLAAFIVLSLGNIEMFDAAIMALSLPASGGMIPHSDGFAGYDARLPSLMVPFIMFSGMNFLFISFVMRGTWNKVQDNETETYVVMIFVLGILFWVLAGAGDIDLIPAQWFNAASLLSTNGYILGEMPPLPVAIITALVGGAAVSSAGGFKIQRWLVIMARAREEIRKLVLPNAIQGTAKIKNELGVWMHFLAFTFVLGALTLSFTFTGHSFELATTAAVATLSNAGPLLAIAQGGLADYGAFDSVSKAIMSIAMILGRVEAVAALALFNRAFWLS